jgi:hypothetical protein
MSSSENARREDRFPVSGKGITLVRWDGDRESRRVRLLDCSAHGVGIQDTRPMQPDEKFVLHVRLAEMAMVLYSVRHCEKIDEGTYRIGAKLEGFITDHQTEPEEVLASLLAAGPE